jgi:gluconokinase
VQARVIVVLMGVAGAGKTAVGGRLAARLGWPFLDGDVLHPAANIRKMASGVALSDADRLPWLAGVHRAMAEHAAAGRSVVVACSALKQGYREVLRSGLADTQFVYLRCSPAVLEGRLRRRRGHFFDPALLGSQLEVLEEPADALVINADQPLEVVVDEVVAGLRGTATPK